jgi:hypothetical protein
VSGYQLIGTGLGYGVRIAAQNAAERRAAKAYRGWKSGVDRIPCPPIESPLPVEGWAQTPEFTFGYPFAWRPVTHDEHADLAALASSPLAAAVTNTVTNMQNCSITVERFSDPTEPPYTFALLYSGIPEIISLRQEGSKAEHVGGPIFLGVGGEQAVLLSFRQLVPGERFERDHTVEIISTFASLCHRGVVYGISLVGPEDQHWRWTPGYYTALGSWHWYV